MERSNSEAVDDDNKMEDTLEHSKILYYYSFPTLKFIVIQSRIPINYTNVEFFSFTQKPLLICMTGFGGRLVLNYFQNTDPPPIFQ